ncbi:MAG: hypothetical protein ACM3ZA_13795 [Bacillota bacterium]
MDGKSGSGDAEYVFVQTVVVRSARHSGWLERTLGKGRLQELPRVGVTPPVPRLGMEEWGTAGGSHPPAPGRSAARPQRVDFWINALALGTLGAFLLSLYLVR